MKSHLDIAQQAIELVMPSLDKLFERTNRKELHIVIMDPRIKPWECEFEQAILFETSVGSPQRWTIPFDQFARKKAHQAWRHSCANIKHQSVSTSALREDDILFYGSFVYGEVVVACSGVEQWYDMLISGWIAIAFEQLCMAEYQNNKVQNPTQTLRQ